LFPATILRFQFSRLRLRGLFAASRSDDGVVLFRLERRHRFSSFADRVQSLMKVGSPNQDTGANAGIALLLHISRQRPGIAQFSRSSRHEVAFDTAWLDRFPDQALRVAAGIPRKHASGGLWPSGHYCQRYGAFPAM